MSDTQIGWLTTRAKGGLNRADGATPPRTDLSQVGFVDVVVGNFRVPLALASLARSRWQGVASVPSTWIGGSHANRVGAIVVGVVVTATIATLRLALPAPVATTSRSVQHL